MTNASFLVVMFILSSSPSVVAMILSSVWISFSTPAGAFLYFFAIFSSGSFLYFLASTLQKFAILSAGIRSLSFILMSFVSWLSFFFLKSAVNVTKLDTSNYTQ